MATARTRPPSPILKAAAAAIGEASAVLVPRESLFRHSFEAPVDAIIPDPGQARKRSGEAELAELAATMVEQGQLQPILVRRDPTGTVRWMIVAGERRWRAAVANGWHSILAIEHEGDAEVASLVENLQRVDLNAIEEARGLQRLIDEKGWSQTEAARALGKSKGAISGLLRILTLPSDLLDAVLTSELAIPKNVLIELARVEEPAKRERLLALARAGALTVRALRDVTLRRGEEGNGQPATAVPPAQPRSGRSGLASKLERITARLRAARLAGRTLDEDERQCLLALKDEIERRLTVVHGSAGRTH
jgi:ParB family transcriptional regulator, chromosome partitioning protein